MCETNKLVSLLKLQTIDTGATLLLPAGVSLATGLQVGGSLQSWTQLAQPDALLKLVPALVLVALISFIMARTR